jgi:hypothetical protein
VRSGPETRHQLGALLFVASLPRMLQLECNVMPTASTFWRSGLYLAAVVFLLSIAGATLAQDHRRDRSLDDYEILLDTIFSRDLNGAVYAFALRLLPSFRLESQLLVSVRDDATVSAEIARVTGKSAWDTLNDRLESDPVFSIGELASTIQVERQPIKVELATARRWQASFLDASRATIEELQRRARASRSNRTETIVVTADGTSGELWYSQRDIDVHWGPLPVPDMGEKTRSQLHVPMARWMREVMDAAQDRVPRDQPR